MEGPNTLSFPVVRGEELRRRAACQLSRLSRLHNSCALSGFEVSWLSLSHTACLLKSRVWGFRLFVFRSRVIIRVISGYGLWDSGFSLSFGVFGVCASRTG